MSGLKNHTFRQGIYAVSSSERERIGTLRITRDGRKFRYTKNGAVALVAGHCLMPATAVANLLTEAAAAAGAASVGDDEITFTAGGAVTYAADYFKGGVLNMVDGAGLGHSYVIESSAAVAAGTVITLKLADALRFAVVAADEWDLVQHPNMAVLVTTGVTVDCAGVAHIAVPASYYFWAQTKGYASVVDAGAGSVVGAYVGPTAAGECVTVTTALDVDQTRIGKAVAAGAADDAPLIDLMID